MLALCLTHADGSSAGGQHVFSPPEKQTLSRRATSLRIHDYGIGIFLFICGDVSCGNLIRYFVG